MGATISILDVAVRIFASGRVRLGRHDPSERGKRWVDRDERTRTTAEAALCRHVKAIKKVRKSRREEARGKK